MFLPSITQPASALPGAFQTTRAIDPSTLSPKRQYDSEGHPSGDKLVDGRRVYRIPAQYVDDAGVDSTVTVSVFNPPEHPIPPLTQLVLTGTVHMVPWVRNGRTAWSLTADGVAVVDSTTGEIHD